MHFAAEWGDVDGDVGADDGAQGWEGAGGGGYAALLLTLDICMRDDTEAWLWWVGEALNKNNLEGS